MHMYVQSVVHVARLEMEERDVSIIALRASVRYMYNITVCIYMHMYIHAYVYMFIQRVSVR